jgi:hypothetical protein
MAITNADVRRFLRDYPSWNILLDAVQFTDDDIEAAKKFAVAEFNVMTPVSAFAVDTFPQDWLMLLGTTAHLMTSESFLQLRNQLSYGDGNLAPVGIDDKASAYISLRNAIRGEWRETAQKYKQQMNMESGYGSLSSGYRFIRTGTRSG